MQTIEPVAQGAQGLDAPKPQTLAQCHEVIDTLVQRVAELQREISWLHERVTLNSKTSSKPPSSDGPGSYRALVEEAEIDQVIDCPAPEVCECGAPVMPVGEPVRHQVFDVPEVRAQVSEYRLHGGCCTACGKARRGTLPAGVPRGQLGPWALALIGVLGTQYHRMRMQWNGRPHPQRHGYAKVEASLQPFEQRGRCVMKVTTVGIDLAKNVWQIHGVDEHGKTALKKQLKRAHVGEFFANLTAAGGGVHSTAYASAPDWPRSTLVAKSSWRG